MSLIMLSMLGLRKLEASGAGSVDEANAAKFALRIRLLADDLALPIAKYKVRQICARSPEHRVATVPPSSCPFM